jgi:DNA-directed RNA polymerase specialized sigma24 family protein
MKLDQPMKQSIALILLGNLEGLSPKEIADKHNLSPLTVKMVLARYQGGLYAEN